jgi:RNA polymerase sigma-70 factor (ECF subfamily)
MERAQQGEREAFHDLFEEIGPLITRFVRRRLFDQQQVEDVCQEVLIAVYQSRRTYQPARPFEPWLFAIVRNVTGRYLRRNRLWSAWEAPIDDIPEVGTEDDSGLAVEWQEALGQLSPTQIEALRLTKLVGLSVAEASERTGASVGTMKVRVHRAYESLRRSILR